MSFYLTPGLEKTAVELSNHSKVYRSVYCLIWSDLNHQSEQCSYLPVGIAGRGGGVTAFFSFYLSKKRIGGGALHTKPRTQ